MPALVGIFLYFERKIAILIMVKYEFCRAKYANGTIAARFYV